MLKDRDDDKYVAKKATKVEEKIERTGGKKPSKGSAWHGFGPSSKGAC
jgi:hypothetical protein